jgi:hypothetical protein
MARRYRRAELRQWTRCFNEHKGADGREGVLGAAFTPGAGVLTGRG